MFVDHVKALHQAGQGLRRYSWPEGWYLRCVEGEPGEFGYELIKGDETGGGDWWEPTTEDLAANDWYLDDLWAG